MWPKKWATLRQGINTKKKTKKAFLLENNAQLLAGKNKNYISNTKNLLSIHLY